MSTISISPPPVLLPQPPDLLALTARVWFLTLTLAAAAVLLFPATSINWSLCLGPARTSGLALTTRVLARFAAGWWLIELTAFILIVVVIIVAGFLPKRSAASLSTALGSTCISHQRQ